MDVSKLLGLHFESLSGYLTGGGTESNIYSMWVARNWAGHTLSGPGKIQWIIPKSSHYSIVKGIDILGLRESKNHQLTYIDYDDTFTSKLEVLEETISNHTKLDKNSPLIIILTIITTEFGLIDPLERVIDCIKDNKLKNVFIHVDACYSGMILPFVDVYKNLFSFKEISSISVDFHKTLGGPIGSGIVLLNHGYEKFCNIEASYLDGRGDETLSGSRNGISAIQVWGLIKKHGVKGLQKQVKTSISLTKYFYSQIKEFSGIKVLYPPFINYLILEDISSTNLKKKELELLLKEYSISATTVQDELQKTRRFYKVILNHYTPK